MNSLGVYAEGLGWSLGVYAGSGLFQSRCLCGDNWLESQISVDKTPEELPAEISWRAFQPLKHLKFKTLRRPPEGVFAALVKVLRLVH